MDDIPYSPLRYLNWPKGVMKVVNFGFLRLRGIDGSSLRHQRQWRTWSVTGECQWLLRLLSEKDSTPAKQTCSALTDPWTCRCDLCLSWCYEDGSTLVGGLGHRSDNSLINKEVNFLFQCSHGIQMDTTHRKGGHPLSKKCGIAPPALYEFITSLVLVLLH